MSDEGIDWEAGYWELVLLARQVVACWEQGDLAEAVRDLADALPDTTEKDE